MKCKQITNFSVNGKSYPQEYILPVTRESDEPSHLESGVLNIYPSITYQTIEGFGGAITESNAYLLSNMNEATRKSALEEFFGENGNHMKFVRIHMDSCDYSLEEYTAVKDPVADPELVTFSIERDMKYIIPILKDAISMSAEPLSVLLSPWSPPACWKTSPKKANNDALVYGEMLGFKVPEVSYDKPSRCNGGSLKPEFYDSWARYLVKYVLAYLLQGVPVTMMSIQNESIAATDWDSCVWTAEEQKTFLRDYLYPKFVDAGLIGKVGIYIWDHNKERVLEYAMGVIDDVTDKMIEGIAFHWYSGDHFEAVEMTAKKYPDKTLLMSECCVLHPPGRANFLSFMGNDKMPETVEYEDAVCYAHDIIGNLNAGMNRWIDWNLCVDKDGGPRHDVPGGFAACMIANDDGTYRKNLTYDYIGSFSRYIMPNSVRIGFSRCDGHIEMTAVKNQDGSVVVVILNKNNDDKQYVIRMDGNIIRIKIPTRTINTFIMW